MTLFFQFYGSQVIYCSSKSLEIKTDIDMYLVFLLCRLVVHLLDLNIMCFDVLLRSEDAFDILQIYEVLDPLIGFYQFLML